MKADSPLRYPGGKASMSGLLGRIRKLNGLGGLSVAEPFAGGAGASLTLLYLEETQTVYINDADPAIHDFWWSLLNEPQRFVSLLQRTRVTVSEWRRQRSIYTNVHRTSRLSRGFSTFYLNRCNRSGIIMNGGPIGGISQTGKWKLNARFNKAELLRRCRKIFEYGSRIFVSGDDGIEFLERMDSKSSFFFIDPPYFVKGPTLYLNALSEKYHSALAEKLRSMETDAWILTYDDCPQVRRMYRDWAAIRPFSLRYSASDHRQGREILIAPKWMRLPVWSVSDALA